MIIFRKYYEGLTAIGSEFSSRFIISKIDVFWYIFWDTKKKYRGSTVFLSTVMTVGTFHIKWVEGGRGGVSLLLRSGYVSTVG